MGKMNTCSDSLQFSKYYCVGQIPYSDETRVWVTFYNNFGELFLLYSSSSAIESNLSGFQDWIGRSIFSAYQVATSDTWFGTMLEGIDSTGCANYAI